jgi:uncharacterized protein (TIGR03435 family)
MTPVAASLFIVLFFAGLASSGSLNFRIAILETFMRGIARTSGELQPVKPEPRVALNPLNQQQAVPNLPPAPAAPAEPTFEEASIRPCDPDNLPPTPPGARGGGANSFQMSPGRTYALCMTLATLVRTAYGFAAYDDVLVSRAGQRDDLALNTVYGLGAENGRRVRGGPDWVRSERYTIEAVASSMASAATMQHDMLRALLERRFQLRAHIESEQVPAFALTAARGGPKITPMIEGGCDTPPPPTPGRSNFGARRSVAELRAGVKPWCGLGIFNNPPNQELVGGGVTLEDFGSLLGATLGGVEVLDRVGNGRRFNLVLEFAIDDNAPGVGRRGAAPRDGGPPDAVRAPTIFTAIEEQLGLRLEPVQAPREFIVIDQVERPTAN